jgi:hypothetical protein
MSSPVALLEEIGATQLGDGIARIVGDGYGDRSSPLVDRVLVAAEFADFDCPSGQLAVVKGLACIESGVDGSVELDPRLLPQPATWRQRHPARQLCVFLLENKLETERK